MRVAGINATSASTPLDGVALPSFLFPLVSTLHQQPSPITGIAAADIGDSQFSNTFHPSVEEESLEPPETVPASNRRKRAVWSIIKEGSRKKTDLLSDHLGQTPWYTERKDKKTVRWTCTRKHNGCRGAAIPFGDSFKIVSAHSWSPIKDVSLTKRINAAAKKKAIKGRTTATKQIVELEFLKEFKKRPDADFPLMTTVMRNTRRAKSCMYPSHPTKINFKLDIDHISEKKEDFFS